MTTNPYPDPGEREEPPLAPLFKEHPALLMGAVPHMKAIGLTLEDYWRANALVRVPYSPQLIGNPETGVIHGGVITAILDSACGIAVFCAMTELTNTATLDLRIDYMRPSTKGAPILAHAECTRMARTIAFVRGTAYNDDPGDPIATSTAAFMVG